VEKLGSSNTRTWAGGAPTVLANWANARSPLGIGLGATTTLGGGRGLAQDRSTDVGTGTWRYARMAALTPLQSRRPTSPYSRLYLTVHSYRMVTRSYAHDSSQARIRPNKSNITVHMSGFKSNFSAFFRERKLVPLRLCGIIENKVMIGWSGSYSPFP
jgi:hypothetical protein